MLVFNLTNQPVVYRDRTIPPEGSFDYKDIEFIPSRDQELAKARILAFGERPLNWVSVKPPAMTVAQVAALKTPVLETPKVEERVDAGVRKKKF